MKTTCIGAYPKPHWLPLHDWFQVEQGLANAGDIVTDMYTQMLLHPSDDLEGLLSDATHQAVADQIACGIDIPTDGEQRRENYVHYQCRNIRGFDFGNLTKRVLRNGAYETSLPTISSKIEATGVHVLPNDWQIAQSKSQHPVKITIPGPITIMDTTANDYYKDDKSLAFDLARALNEEIKALAKAGCKHIQIDEPLFARRPDDALDYGLEALEICFDGVDEDVNRIMHMCCGYSAQLDDDAYLKADANSYFKIATALDQSSIQQVSIEDAHRFNDLTLLEKFTKTTIIFGSIAIAKSRIETVEEVSQRLSKALEHINKDQIIAAPDCGLGFLTRELAMKKLKVLTQAASLV